MLQQITQELLKKHEKPGIKKTRTWSRSKSL